MTIQAIETEYNGYRFRSRTEARWAVFFDHIGIRYHYELEGYSVNSGGYLPDFYLPQVDSWAEVKGPEFTRDEFQKIADVLWGEYNNDRQNTKCLLLAGPPDFRYYPQVRVVHCGANIHTFQIINVLLGKHALVERRFWADDFTEISPQEACGSPKPCRLLERESIKERLCSLDSDYEYAVNASRGWRFEASIT